MKWIKHIRATILGVLLLHTLWLLGSLWIGSSALPNFIAVYKHLPTMLSGELLEHLGVSLIRVLWGIACSLLLATPIAWALFSSRRFGQILESFVYLSYPIPKLALLPVVMLLCGLGEVTKVVMIVLIILFQLVISLRDALKQIPRDTIKLMQSLGAGRWAFVRHIYLPAILPSLFGALRIALGTAISVLFVTETYGTSRGMGYYIVNAWMRVDYLEMYAAIVVLGCLGFALFVLLDILEYIFCPWAR